MVEMDRRRPTQIEPPLYHVTRWVMLASLARGRMSTPSPATVRRRVDTLDKVERERYQTGSQGSLASRPSWREFAAEWAGERGEADDMKLGNCTILSAVKGIHGADAYEVELADSGRRLVVRITSRAVPPLSDAAAESEDFLADAATVAALDHPNVLGIVDYGEQGGVRFLIEPFVDDSLFDYLTSGHTLPLPLHVARQIIGEVAAGLQYLHDEGLVHGHVNVRTVFLEPAPVAPDPSANEPSGTPAPPAEPTFRARVGDLGLHRYLDEPHATGREEAFEAFLAPEQHDSAAVAASDQYALAVTAHLLLTGRLPVISSRSRPIEDVSPGDLVPPSQLNPALPPAIDFLLMTALQPEAGQRFRRVQDLATALEIATGAKPRAASAPVERRDDATRAPTASDGNVVEDLETARIGFASATPPSPGSDAPANVPAKPAAASAPPAAAIYKLPKAPPYTEPVRAVKIRPAASASRAIARIRVPRRSVLLGIAGGLLGAATLGGAGIYFFTRGTRAADSIGFFRPSTATFALLSNLAARDLDLSVRFGQVGDLPLAGDWDGDGIDTPGVFRPSTGVFSLADSNRATPRVAREAHFGQAGDIPLAGDWPGSGRDGIGVFRPATGQFLLKRAPGSGPADITIAFGAAGDLPVVGDWTGSGRDGIGVYRARTDTFYLLRDANASAQRPPSPDLTLRLGVGTGLPLAGDWQRAGQSGVGLFVPATRTIYLKQHLTPSGAPDIHRTVGASGDLPVAGRWR